MLMWLEASILTDKDRLVFGTFILFGNFIEKGFYR